MLGLMALWLGGLGFGVDRDEQPSENKKKHKISYLFTIIKKGHMKLFTSFSRKKIGLLNFFVKLGTFLAKVLTLNRGTWRQCKLISRKFLKRFCLD